MAAKAKKVQAVQDPPPKLLKARSTWHAAPDAKLTEPQQAAREKWRSSALHDDQASLMQLEALDADTTKDLAPNFQARTSLLIPYFKLDGSRSEFYRIRYLGAAPGWQGAQAKPQRYAQPKGTVNEVYLPPYADDPAWWEAAGANPNIPVFFTEGEIKAASMCAIGFPTGGLGGVDMVGSNKKGIELFAPLDEFAWTDREVTILFDSDGLENLDVQAAQLRMAHKLVNAGATVRYGFVPPGPDGEKQGADDWIARALAAPGATTESVRNAFEEQVLDAAIPYVEGSALHGFNEVAVLIERYNQVLRRADGRLLQLPGAQVAFAPYRHWLTVGDKTKQVSTLDEWLKWKHRFTLADLCYAPGKPEVVSGKYNTWRASGVEPIPTDGCPPWWDWLLDRCLFENAPMARRWAEQWAAYPLQNPGAKLATALALVSQVEGIGKTLFANTLGALYGHNFITIGDAELDATFNGWCANKQLICGNEVSGRRKAAYAKLQALITDMFVQVNEKFLPAVTLENVANFVFTTNDLEVFGINNNDRRVYVHEINTKPRPNSEYKAFAEWANSARGKGELLYYLLTLQIDSFDPGARAPDSPGRQAMIASVRPPPDEALYELVINMRQRLCNRFGQKAGTECDLWTAEELFQCVPEHQREGVSLNAFSRAVKRFQSVLARVNGGEPVHVPMAGALRLIAVENLPAYRMAMPVALSDHRLQHGPKTLTATHGM